MKSTISTTYISSYSSTTILSQLSAIEYSQCETIISTFDTTNYSAISAFFQSKRSALKATLHKTYSNT